MNDKQHSVSLFDNQLISVEKLAQILSVPTDTVRCWVYKRYIPFIKIGRHIRFRLEPDIRLWINERKKDVDKGY